MQEKTALFIVESAACFFFPIALFSGPQDASRRAGDGAGVEAKDDCMGPRWWCTDDVYMIEEHRIQVRVKDEDWERAERAATGKGLSTVAALCRCLLEEEFARQGIDKGPGASTREPASDEEHRIQVRVKDAEWKLAEQAAETRGLPTVSALCRALLEKEFARLAAAQSSARVRRGKKRARRQ